MRGNLNHGLRLASLQTVHASTQTNKLLRNLRGTILCQRQRRTRPTLRANLVLLWSRQRESGPRSAAGVPTNRSSTYADQQIAAQFAGPDTCQFQKTGGHDVPSCFLEQATGIEPAYPAWEAGVLPLNYACKLTIVILHYSGRFVNPYLKNTCPARRFCATFFSF